MENNEALEVSSNLPVAEFIFNTVASGENGQNIELGFFLFYMTIAILLAVCYKLGFARKLPLLKSFFVYIILFFGAFIIAFMGMGMPMAESLIIIVAILGTYRFRLYKDRKMKQQIN